MTVRWIVNGEERRQQAGDERKVGLTFTGWHRNLAHSQWRQTSRRHPRRGVERIHYRKGHRCLILEVAA